MFLFMIIVQNSDLMVYLTATILNCISMAIIMFILVISMGYLMVIKTPVIFPFIYH